MASILRLGGQRTYDRFTQMHLGDLLHYIAQQDPDWIKAMRVWAEDKARTLAGPQVHRPPSPPAA